METAPIERLAVDKAAPKFHRYIEVTALARAAQGDRNQIDCGHRAGQRNRATAIFRLVRGLRCD
jgi:hypothetical protein